MEEKRCVTHACFFLPMRSDTFQLLIEYFVCYRDEFSSNFAPQVGMEFNSIHEAWLFWVNYGGQKGFEVRKRYSNKRKSDGKIMSYIFVCANEGHRLKDKRDHLIKSPRAETRTDCEVRMGLVLDREKGNYKVTEVILEHNHTLQLPQTSHLLVSQRKITGAQSGCVLQVCMNVFCLLKMSYHDLYVVSGI